MKWILGHCCSVLDSPNDESLCGDPYDKDSSILGSTLGTPLLMETAKSTKVYLEGQGDLVSRLKTYNSYSTPS